jgi:glycosyltransferase involved in cell wall biosynthesis
VRVLVLSWRDLSHPQAGGAEVYVETICAGLAARGHQVTLVCSSFPGAPVADSRDGYAIVRMGGRFTVFARVALAGRRGGLGDPDVIIDAQSGMPFLSPLWTGAPVVVLVHHVHRDQWKLHFPAAVARLGWLLESRVATHVQRGATYVAVSEATRSDLAALGVSPTRVTVVPNGTAPPEPVDVARATRPTVCVLGRLVAHKRVELAVEAVSRLPGVRLEIAGDGPSRAHVEQAVRSHRVTDRVAVLGRVTEADKARLLARSWALLVPSVNEGWGLSVVEAAMHRTPALAFAGAGGLSESILNGRTGLLVDAGDDPAGALAHALERLLHDDLWERLGRNAREHAAGFTWESSVRRFEQVLREAVATDGCRS